MNTMHLRTLVLCLLPSLAAAQPVETIHRFEVPPFAPLGGLVEAGDGFLYGTTSEGGSGGTIYRLPVAGGPPTVVHRFERGRLPDATLTRGQGGVLYGTTRLSTAADGIGTVYRFDPATASVVTLHVFGPGDASFPAGGVIQASDGLLYGATEYLPSVFQLDPETGRTRWLHEFETDFTDRPLPCGRLTETGGALFGILCGTGRGPYQYGAIYRVDLASGAVTVVYEFGSGSANPAGGLTLTTDGWLYGTTGFGGFEARGLVFRYRPGTGVFEVVHELRPFNGDPAGPATPLVQAADGSLYGIGLGDTFGAGAGRAIFRLSRPDAPVQSFTVVRSLDPAAIGALPYGDLTLASDGWIYGVARDAGPSDGGTIFRFDSLLRGAAGDPWQVGLAHAFTNRGPGWRPGAPPTVGADGALYGLTNAGGANGWGDVYRIDPATGARTSVGSVPSPTAPAAAGLVRRAGLNGRLVAGADGSFYATSTELYGSYGRILRVTPSTGTVTSVLDLDLPMGAVGFDSGLVGRPAGLVFLRLCAAGLTVMRFDPGSNTATPVTTVTNFAFGAASAALTLGGDGRFYVSFTSLVLVGRIDTPLREIYRVDPTTATSTLLISRLGQYTGSAPLLAIDGALYYGDGDALSQRLVAWTVAGGEQPVCRVPGYAITGVVQPADGGSLLVVSTGPFPATAALYRCPVLAGATPDTLATRVHVWDASAQVVSALAPSPGGSFYGVTAGRQYGYYDEGGSLFRVRLFDTPAFDADGDGLTSTFESTYGLDPASAAGADGPSGDPDGDGVSNVDEQAAGTHPRGTFVRYLAEGASNAFFRTRIALANPGLSPATVLLRFQTDAGVTVPYVVTVLPTSRATVDADAVPQLGNASFSTVIESDVPLVVDRTMTWDATGYGSHAETALAAPSTTWYFAEGSTSGDFALFYLLQNPQATAVTATVRYLRPLGFPPIERTYTLPPQSRTTIAVDGEQAELASTDLSAVVTATAPILAERAMYLSRAGQPFAAGHASAGVTAPALEWFLPEGATGAFFDMFVLVANPNPTPASITAEYLLLGGGSLTKTYTVPANGRFTIWVDDEQLPAGSGQRPLANAALSTTIRSTNGVPVIVERTMWWPSPETSANYWYEAHNSPGATTTALRWGVAGGAVGGLDTDATYLLIANTSASAGQAQVRLYFPNGNTTARTYPLPARSRTNVSLADDFPEPRYHQAVAAVVESIGANPVTIVVEAANYANVGGVIWARGSDLLATPLP
jgi:uncharacterized repeat protein (TIGR03803 family)